MKRIGLGIGLVSLALVGAVAWWEFTKLTTPGDLHASHSGLPALSGSKGCAVCHGDANTSMSSACLACHQDIEAHMSGGIGLHGNLTSAPADQCHLCHVEHTNGAVGLVSMASFRHAGIAKLDVSAHRLIGKFDLHGRHSELACSRCHALADTAALKPGEHRFLGLSQTCTSCHNDPHHGSFGLDCDSCHGQQVPFNVVAEFEHIEAFPLVHSHAGLSCNSCHEDGTPYALATIQTQPPDSIRQCIDCHASPHTEQFISGVAQVENVMQSATCVLCHEVAHDSFRYPQARMTDQWHGASGFELEPPHDTQECSECHVRMAADNKIGASTAATAAFAISFPGRGNNDCRACHGDPHHAQFDRPGHEAQCISCHDAAHFVPSTFDVQRHAQTDFALSGAHENLVCGSCHIKVNGVTRFANTPTSCASCHGDPHLGQFNTGGQTAQCTQCHSDERFAPSTFDENRHEHVFPLTGAHSHVECASCHISINGVQRFAGTPGSCAACHEDPHAAQFAHITPHNDCAECHGTERFQPTQFGFERHAQTRFPLVGGHQAVGCRHCHKEVRGVRQFTGSSLECASCHVDVHRGAFDAPQFPKVVDGKSGCARCHHESSFSDVKWTGETHARWTGYPLTGAHAKLACSDCHRRDQWRDLAADMPRVSSDCASCHADPHVGQFAVSGATDCSRCHTELSTFRQTTFDHQRDSRFPLDQTHIKLSCNQCHKPVTIGDRLSVIRYKPLGRECQDCHGFKYTEK